MKIEFRISSTRPRSLHYLTSFAINDVISLDAGSLGIVGSPRVQSKILDVVLTHAHIDHIATLPIFLENVYGLTPRPIAIHATAETIASLHQDVFNDRLYPTLGLLNGLTPPFCTLHEVVPRKRFTVAGLTWEAIPLMHPSPCVGYRISDGNGTIVMATDTADCPGLRELLEETPRLRAVFLEASFPETESILARASQHLTVTEFIMLAKRLPASVAVYGMHVKARFRTVIERAIRCAGRDNLHVLQSGQTIEVTSSV